MLEHFMVLLHTSGPWTSTSQLTNCYQATHDIFMLLPKENIGTTTFYMLLLPDLSTIFPDKQVLQMT